MTDPEIPVWQVHRTAEQLVGPIVARSRTDEVLETFELAVGVDGAQPAADTWGDPTSALGADGTGLYYLTTVVARGRRETLYLRLVDAPETLVQVVATIVRT